MTQKLAYLACPYAHPDPEIKTLRHHLVNRMALELHKRGRLVYSPLTHNIPLIELSGKGNSWEDWGSFDLNVLSRCDELIVLTIPGWEESKGVAHEIAHAKKLNLPIEMMDPKEYFNFNLTLVHSAE